MGEKFETEQATETTETHGSNVAAELKASLADTELSDVEPVAPEKLPELGVKVGDQILLTATNEVWEIESIVKAARIERYIARIVNLERDSPKLTKDVGELVQRLDETNSAWSRYVKPDDTEQLAA